MKIIDEVKLDYQDVLIRPKSSETASRKGVDLIRKIEFFPHSPRQLRVIPIVAANMDTTGTFNMANQLHKHGWITCLHKHYSVDDIVMFFHTRGIMGWNAHLNYLAECTWLSMGMFKDDIEKVQDISRNLAGFTPNLCVDVANGYTDDFVKGVGNIRKAFPNSIIMAGNVATPEMVERLIRQGGADIVKVGVGPGSVCTTRLVAGVGYPQLSAVLECADAAHGSSHGYICADGGCTTSGDVCKALGANADFVMLGGMLAGADECEGEWEYETEPKEFYVQEEIVTFTDSGQKCYTKFDTGEKYTKHVPTTRKKSLKYYGMSSYSAHDKHDGHKDYRASEGKAVTIPYKGPVEGIVKQVEGGLRSCCAYIGAQEIKHMGRCTTFVKVRRTHNAIFENGDQHSTEEIRGATGSN